jgi:UDP-perosamine 4-acetyltransferase
MNKKRKTLIVGAGGHARVVASLLMKQPDIEVVGVVDRTNQHMGERVGNFYIVTSFDDLSLWYDRDIHYAAIALGNVQERAEAFATLKQIGFKVVSAIHRSSIIEDDVELGEGVTICAGVILATQTKIGKNVLINTGTVIDHESVIGDHSHVAPGCRIAGRVCIGERTFMGIGVTVKEKLRIGSRCTIGAGAVVLSSIPDDSIAYGVTASLRILKDHL